MRASRLWMGILIVSGAVGGSALADGGMTIRVLNDTPDNLIVTLVDRTVRPPQPVISGAIINGNASVSVSIGMDSSGHGRLSWTAATVDADMRRCASRQKSAVQEGATVHVFANRRCSSH